MCITDYEVYDSIPPVHARTITTLCPVHSRTLNYPHRCVPSPSYLSLHNPHRDLRLALTSLPASRTKMQCMHAALPRPPRQPKHLRVLHVVPHVQLERHNEALRGALCLLLRPRCRGRVRRDVYVGHGEAWGELPDVWRGQV